MSAPQDFSQFNPKLTLDAGDTSYTVFSVKALESLGYDSIHRLPYSLRILLENLLRHYPQGLVSDADIHNLASWQPDTISPEAVPLMPARVILQDFTGVPALVDLAAMRSSLARAGGDPATMNPFIPADLVIDHSVQVDKSASADSLEVNVDMEMQRKPRTVHHAPLGATGFYQLSGRPSGDRHCPSGQPGIPGLGCGSGGTGRCPGTLPRLRTRYRFSHHHGQRFWALWAGALVVSKRKPFS